MNAIKKFYSNIICNRVYCIMLFIVLTALSASPLLQIFVGRFVKVAFVWGAFLVLRDLVRSRTLIKNRYSFWLFLFCVAYAVSILLAAPSHLTENVTQFSYMILFMILFFGNDITTAFDKKLYELILITNSYIWVTFVLVLTCLVLLLFSINFTYYHERYGYLTVGLSGNRFWGLYNPNTGSAIGIISIFFCWMMLLIKKNTRKAKAFYIVNIVLQYIYILFTQSRTAWYTLLIFGSIILFVQLFLAFQGKFKKVWANAITIGAAVIILAAGVDALKPKTVKAISYLPSVIRQIDEIIFNKGSFSGGLQPVIEERDDLYNDETKDATNGRVEIWNAAFKTFKESPVFGVTRECLYDRVSPYLPERRQQNVNVGGLHNIYITVLVSSGLVGFAIITIFVSSICRTLLFRRNLPVTPGNLWQYLLMVIPFAFFLMEFFESRILYRSNIFSVVFWIFTGYLMYFAEKDIMQHDDSILRNNWVVRLENLARRIFIKKRPAN